MRQEKWMLGAIAFQVYEDEKKEKKFFFCSFDSFFSSYRHSTSPLDIAMLVIRDYVLAIECFVASNAGILTCVQAAVILNIPSLQISVRSNIDRLFLLIGCSSGYIRSMCNYYYENFTKHLLHL